MNSHNIVLSDDEQVELNRRSAIHEPHLPPAGVLVYCGISGEQFQGKSAS